MKNKASLRNTIKTLFKQEPFEAREVCDRAIQEHIGEYLEQSVCIYESMSDEVNTNDIIQKLLKIGGNAYVPKIISDTQMQLIDCKSRKVYTGSIDVFIIPGRAFTRDGKRLGRGKGYYDRFLSQEKYKNSKKVGICYNFQILKDIPTEKHDISMDKIISN